MIQALDTLPDDPAALKAIIRLCPSEWCQRQPAAGGGRREALCDA